MNYLRNYRLFSSSAVRSVRVPKEMIKHPKHPSYEETEYEPGTHMDITRNVLGNWPKRLARPIIPVQYLFKGDYVYIHYGKDKGKRGVVAQVLQKESKVFVAGKNCKWEQLNLGAQTQWNKIEEPLLMQHVSLLDPELKEPTPVDFKYNELGELVRVSRSTGRIIPYPEVESNPVQEDSSKDTPKELCEEKTYKMELDTFEDSVLKAHGLEDEIELKKRKHPTWFY